MDTNHLDRRAIVGLSLASVVVATSGITAAEAQTRPTGGSKLQEVLARGRLIVGTGSDIPPYYFTNEKGELVGFEIDLARLLARGLFNDPTKVEFIIQNADARIPNLLSDRVDLTLQNLTVTPARAQQAEFTLPYYRAGQGFLMLANGRYSDFQALKAAGSAVTISALQNVTAEAWIKQALPEAKVEQFPSPDAAVQALNSRRADAQMITYGRVRWAVTQFPDRYRDSGFTFKPNSIAIAVKPGDAIWLNWLNTALREAMAGVDFDIYAASFKRWMGEDLPVPRLGFPREMEG